MAEIFKFGGALLNDANGVKRMYQIVSNYRKPPFVIVVSALGKTTNALENILFSLENNDVSKANFLLEQLKTKHFTIVDTLFDGMNKNSIFSMLDRCFDRLKNSLENLPDDIFRAYDTVVSFGERLATTVIGEYLRANGIKAKNIDSSAVIITDSNFTSASIDWDNTCKSVNENISPLLEKGYTVIVQGFTGADRQGRPTTLGREGSDFTAAVISKCLNVNELTIWKDVPGFMNCDPKIFDDAVQLMNLSYHEAIELAFYGASVVHPKTIQPLQSSNIILKIRDFYDLKREPTIISNSIAGDSTIPKIIVKKNQCLLSISSKTLSFIAEENIKDIFDIFGKHKVHVNMMQNSAVSFSVCFDKNDEKLQMLLNSLSKLFTVKYNSGLTLYTIKNAGDKMFQHFTAGKTVYLLQESRNTLRFLVK
jgi:aspartate kinase